jgi:uncharacterized membrane protein YfcA
MDWLVPDTTLPLVSWPGLTCVGLVAGLINAIAGGGSVITLPTLIFFGLPAGVANGTNRVALLVQNIGAVRSFARHGRLDRGWLLLAAPPAVVGAVLGMIIAIRTGDQDLQRVLAVMMLLIAGYMVWSPISPPRDGSAPAVPTGARRLLFAAGFFVIGVYGGFIQAGSGFIVLALASAGGLDYIRSNALKLTLVLCFTPLALIGFASQGLVDWGAGLALALGNLTGALIGVRIAVKKGSAWVRRVVVVLVVVFAAVLWIQA